MKKLLLLLMLSVLTVFFPLPKEVFPQTTWPSDSIITTGIGNITDGDIARAQNEAIVDAQKKAVMQAVGMVLPFDLMEGQFFFLTETIFDRAADYIEHYRVLYESTLGDRYHITIQSAIAFKTLEDYLLSEQFLTSKVKLPRILLMIAQQKLKQSFYTCWWSFIDPEKELTVIDQILKDTLQKKGFEVIDHSYMIQETPLNGVYGCLDLKPGSIQTLGEQFKADIAIVGNAHAELTAETEDPPQKSVQVNITARAVKIADGTVVVNLNTYFPATEDDEETAQIIALKKASSTFAHQMGEQVSSQWIKENKGIGLITLSISGLSTYLDFSRLRSTLKKEIPEIHNLLQKTLSDESALIEVETMLDTSSLAEKISVIQFEKFTISITTVSPAVIEMEVKSKAENLEQKKSTTNNTD